LRFTIAPLAAQGRDISKLVLQSRVRGAYRNFDDQKSGKCRTAFLPRERMRPRRAASIRGRSRLFINRLDHRRRTAKALAGRYRPRSSPIASTMPTNFRHTVSFWNIFCDCVRRKLSKGRCCKATTGFFSRGSKDETRATARAFVDRTRFPGGCITSLQFLTEELWAIKGEAGRAAPERFSWRSAHGLASQASGNSARRGLKSGWVRRPSFPRCRRVAQEMNVGGGQPAAAVLVGGRRGWERSMDNGWNETIPPLARLSGP